MICPICRDTYRVTLNTGEIALYKMRSKSGWNNRGNGDNSSNFSAYPNVMRLPNGNWEYNGDHSNWWTSKEWNIDAARYFGISADSTQTTGSVSKENGLHIRCIKDSANEKY